MYFREVVNKEVNMSSLNAILIVDDNSLERKKNSALARLLGFQVYEAETGQSGMDMFNAKADQICLIIMDYEMPGLNGYEAILRIRNELPEGKDVPIILYSGTAPEIAPANFSSPLISQVITKSNDIHALRLAIMHWAHRYHLKVS